MPTGLDTPPLPTVENLVDGILDPNLLQVSITVPESKFIVYGRILRGVDVTQASREAWPAGGRRLHPSVAQYATWGGDPSRGRSVSVRLS